MIKETKFPFSGFSSIRRYKFICSVSSTLGFQYFWFILLDRVMYRMRKQPINKLQQITYSKRSIHDLLIQLIYRLISSFFVIKEIVKPISVVCINRTANQKPRILHATNERTLIGPNPDDYKKRGLSRRSSTEDLVIKRSRLIVSNTKVPSSGLIIKSILQILLKIIIFPYKFYHNQILFPFTLMMIKLLQETSSDTTSVFLRLNYGLTSPAPTSVFLRLNSGLTSPDTTSVFLRLNYGLRSPAPTSVFLRLNSGLTSSSFSSSQHRNRTFPRVIINAALQYSSYIYSCTNDPIT